MSTLTSMKKMISIVHQYHTSCTTDEWKKALTIAVLKDLYIDYREANNSGLLPLRNLIVDIIKQVCDHIGASDVEARSLFYNLWLKVVYNLTLSSEEQQSMDMITILFGKQTYAYQVIFETHNRYYHMYEYTISEDNIMSMNAFIQDTHDIDDISGKTFTTPSICQASLEDFEHFVTSNFGGNHLYDHITMSIKFAMIPCNTTLDNLSRYLKQKTILDSMVQMYSWKNLFALR
jgi:hypothetical protein